MSSTSTCENQVHNNYFNDVKYLSLDTRMARAGEMCSIHSTTPNCGL